MDKRYQIFISSTFKDLENERKQVMQAVLNRNCFPAGMELFPAVDIEQFEYIKKVIDDSDYYILIIGARYGSLDANGVSFTEKEYDYAVSKAIPVIAFVHKDIKSIPLGKAETDSVLLKKLEAFRTKVQQGRLVNYWENAFDLRTKVTESLVAAFEKSPRIGWVRADSITTEKSQEIIDLLKREVHELREYKTNHEKSLTNNMIHSNYSLDSKEWDKKYSVTLKIKYSYLNIIFPLTFIDIYYDIKKWFKLIADTIKKCGILADNDHIIKDLNEYFSQSPSILAELTKKEEINIKSTWFKSFFNELPRVLTSDISSIDLSIEKNDLLIILESLIDNGIIAKKGDYSFSEWILTDKGNKLYNSFFYESGTC